MGSALIMAHWGREDGSDLPPLVYLGAMTNTQNNFKPLMSVASSSSYNTRELAS